MPSVTNHAPQMKTEEHHRGQAPADGGSEAGSAFMGTDVITTVQGWRAVQPCRGAVGGRYDQHQARPRGARGREAARRLQRHRARELSAVAAARRPRRRPRRPAAAYRGPAPGFVSLFNGTDFTGWKVPEGTTATGRSSTG